MRTLVLSLLAGAVLFAQPPADAPKPRGPRQPPKNLKLLQPEQVMPVMRAFTASLGVECSFCHVQGQMDSDDKAEKVTARKMMEMTMAINSNHFNTTEMANLKVTCYTCHRGAAKPVTMPPMAQQQPRPAQQ